MPSEKRPLALGAEATLRRKRDADAPTDFGESGPWFERDFEGAVNETGLVPVPVLVSGEEVVAKEAWEG